MYVNHRIYASVKTMVHLVIYCLSTNCFKIHVIDVIFVTSLDRAFIVTEIMEMVKIHMINFSIDFNVKIECMKCGCNKSVLIYYAKVVIEL